MKIAIDASRAAVKEATGTENYSRYLIKYLEKLDSKNQYILYLNQPTPLPLAISKNFTSRLIKLPRFWTQVRLAWEVIQDKPDLLFIPSHTLPVIHKKELKTVVTIHDLGYEYLKEYHQFPQRLYLNKSTVFAAKKATHLIAVSESTKKDLMSKLGVEEEKITVIHEGVDHEIFKPQTEDQIRQVKKKYHLSADYLLFVGTIQPRKNLLRMIEAFNLLLRDSKYQKLNLILVGKEGWLSEEIYKAPIKLSLQDKIRFLNRVSTEDLPALYSGAKMFLFPSLYEGFGLPVLESMASGAPVITSSTSSLPEVAGKAAILINPEETNDLMLAIKSLLDSPEKAEELRKKGFAQSRKFSWEKTAAQTLEVFERLCGK